MTSPVTSQPSQGAEALELQLIPHDAGGVDLAALEAWQAAAGLRLPPAYVSLLTQVDGGYPYPNVARLRLPAEFAVHREGTILSLIYPWESALAERAGKTYGEGVPPEMLFFGRDPSGLELLLSLRPGEEGALYAWQGSTNLWGSDGNDEGALHRQADDLGAFLAGLGDDADQTGLDYVGPEELAEEGVRVVIPLG